MSIKLLNEADLPKDPFELKTEHPGRMWIRERPEETWLCDVCGRNDGSYFHGCGNSNCDTWICDFSQRHLACWRGENSEFNRVGTTWIECDNAQGYMLFWKVVPLNSWPEDLPKDLRRTGKELLLQCSGDLPACKHIHGDRRSDETECTFMVFLQDWCSYILRNGCWDSREAIQGRWVDVEKASACNVPPRAMEEVDPLNVRFTHDCISAKFRGQDQTLDEVVYHICYGRMQFKELPPLEVIKFNDCLWSLSNRRLYIARVLRNWDVIAKVSVGIHAFTSPYLTNLKYDERLKRYATKWERCFSTKTEGKRIWCPGLRHNGDDASLQPH